MARQKCAISPPPHPCPSSGKDGDATDGIRRSALAPARDVRWALNELEHVFPGTSAAYTGRAYEDHWVRDPWVRGAYSYYRVGQADTYGDLAGVSEGRFLFAGEHTSINNIGFLEGAVETGERAARRLLRSVGA